MLSVLLQAPPYGILIGPSFARIYATLAGTSDTNNNKKTMLLPTFGDYTVDHRLKQFRRVHPGDCICGGGDIEFIEFDSDQGRELLTAMANASTVSKPKEIWA